MSLLFDHNTLEQMRIGNIKDRAQQVFWLYIFITGSMTEEVAGGWRKADNEMLHNLSSSLYTI